MRPIKRLMFFLAGLWAFMALASIYSVYLSRRTPAWYVHEPLTALQQSAAANESDQKLADLLSYGSDVAAAQNRRIATGRAGPADMIGPKTISFTESQINAFADKWRVSLGDRIGRYVTSARLVLLDHRLIVAGMLTNMGVLSNTVVSVEFDASMDGQGRVWPRLVRVYSGRLPVPWVVLGNPQRRVRLILNQDIPYWQQHSTISTGGVADKNAAEAVLAKLLLASLDGTSADSIVLIPCDATDMRRVTPVRVEAMEVLNQSLTITIRPLSDSELQTFQSDFHKTNSRLVSAN